MDDRFAQKQTWTNLERCDFPPEQCYLPIYHRRLLDLKRIILFISNVEWIPPNVGPLAQTLMMLPDGATSAYDRDPSGASYCDMTSRYYSLHLGPTEALGGSRLGTRRII